MVLYLYDFKRKTSGQNESYLFLKRKLVEGTSKCNPYIQIFDRNGDIRTFNLKFLVSFNCHESRDLETSILNLSRKLKAPIKFENKFYGDDYQSKIGNEISAHQIDNASCRISSRRVSQDSLKLTPVAAPRLQLTKVYHNNLKDNYFKAAHLLSYEQTLDYLRKGLPYFYRPFYLNMAMLYNKELPVKVLQSLTVVKTLNIQLKLERLWWVKITNEGNFEEWGGPINETNSYESSYLLGILYEPKQWLVPDGRIVLSKISARQLKEFKAEMDKHLG